MIYIDVTFFTRRYKGQILTAIGVDCNNQIIPLAFAFVENENLDIWYWFLERVKVHVVAARPDMCLISDRHAVLLPRARNGKGMTARNGAQGLYRGKGPCRPWGGRQAPVSFFFGHGPRCKFKEKKLYLGPVAPHRTYIFEILFFF